MNTANLNNGTLKYDVLIEQTNENSYTARLLAWADCVVQAPTRAEALEQIRALILERLSKDEIVTLEIQPTEPPHSWLPFAGMWADDPNFEEFQAEIRRNRLELDKQWSPWLFEAEETPEKISEAKEPAESAKELVVA